MLTSSNLQSRSGGQILVDQLLIHGTDTAYCVPGESYLEVLDALYDTRDKIKLINARHEAGASDMAETYGKLTGKPGICMVTRGPGACHAAIGVHIARQDSTPMILFVGQVARETTDREAFQEIDYRAMFGTVAKWVTQIEDASRIPEIIARAYRVATSGRPGPVVVSLPEDMLTDQVKVSDAKPYTVTSSAMADSMVNDIKKALATAERPLMILGGSGWDDNAAASIARFAETNNIPISTSFRRQDAVSSLSSVYAGEFGIAAPPSLHKGIAQADLLLIIGARMGEMTSNSYSVISVPTPEQRLVHIYPDAEEIGRVYSPELGIVCSQSAAADLLSDVNLGRMDAWTSWCAELHQGYLADTQMPQSGDWKLDPGQLLADLRETLPEDTIVTFDAGNHTGFAQRYLRFGRPGRALGSTCGAMGYSVPAGVAASLAHPGRLVLSFVGDGGFLMSCNELETARQYGGTPIVILFNNGIYGTIRMHQENAHPERVSGTNLVHADLCRLAEGLGAYAERVTRTEDFPAAFERARAAGRPAVLELVTDPEQISSRKTITDLRRTAKAADK